MRAILFGSLRLEDNQQRPLPLPPTINGRTLLAYLLLHADQAYGRSYMAALLAPDDSEEKARRTLTQALWQVRRVLPDGAIHTVGDTVQLDGACIERDVDTFDRLMADVFTWETLAVDTAMQVAVGVTLYSADLLYDLYDDWVYLPREQRRERYLHALELLASWEKQNGRFPAALEYILKLTQTDPLRESAHREAMRLYVALERPQAARRHYEQLHRYLQAEMGFPPAAQTRQLAATINAAAGLSDLETAVYLPAAAPAIPYALSDASPMPLIGRELERSQLVAQLHPLSQGQGGLVFLSGAPGVGKSRLLQELVRDAEWRGLAVAWGNGQELDVARPYVIFRDAISTLLTPLRWQQLHTLLDDYWLTLAKQLLSSLEPITHGVQDRGHDPLEALSRLLLALGQLRPLLLILDDVQWVDRSSLEMLIYLSHRLRLQPILVVLAFRSEEARADIAVWQTLDTLDATGLLLRLHLEPLNLEASAEFIRQGLGLRQEAPLFSQRLFAETAGVPLLLLESLRLLHDEGLLYRDEHGQWQTPYDTATVDYAEINLNHQNPTAMGLLERRLRQLPDAAKQTLQLAAVIGHEVQFGWLLAVSSLSQSQVLGSLGLLVQRQFLQETPHAYRFSHDKIRESVYQGIPDTQRQGHHRAIAAVIVGQLSGEQTTRRRNGESWNKELMASLELPKVVVQLAYHYSQGGQWSEAVSYTLQAGDYACKLHALTTALDYYAAARRILEEQRPFPPTEAAQITYHILMARQPLLLLNGQTAQQSNELVELRQLAACLPGTEQQAGALLKEAEFYVEVQASHDQAIILAEKALNIAQQHNLDHLAAEAWRIIGSARYIQGNYQKAAVALHQAVAFWEGVNKVATALPGLYLQLIQVERMNGHSSEGRRLAQNLLVFGETTGNLIAQANAHAALASFYSDSGDHVAAIQSFTAALDIFGRIGARLHEARMLANLGYTHWAMHDYGQAIAMKEEALTIFQELDVQKSILLSYLNLATLYYEIGQTARGEGYTSEGLVIAQQLQLQNYELAIQIGQAQALITMGRLSEGGAVLAEVKPWVEVDEEIHTRASFWASWGMWLMGNGRLSEASNAFVQAIALFKQEAHTDFVTAMQSFHAYALWQAGEYEQALALSTEAVTMLTQTSGGEFIAETYWHHAQISASFSNRAPAASEWVQKAYDTLSQQATSLPDLEWNKPFWSQPIRQAIRAAWLAAQPQRVLVCLPRLESATPNPSTEDPYIEVEWTVWDPADAQIANKVTRRRKQLSRLLTEAKAQGVRPTIANLATALGSSQPTIKRDIAALRFT